MQNITVLGAGYMGSAITFPLSDNGNKVNLWGTWLDDEIIESSLKGFHPRLKKPLPENVNLYYWQDIKPAVEESDVIFIGVASEGFVNVFKLLLDNLNPEKDYYFFKLTKGLVEYNNKVSRATEAARDMFGTKFPGRDFNWTSIGGPVRALDLSERTPTASMYGISNEKIKKLIPDFSTEYYRIFPNNDVKGTEICSMLKNIYAVSAGVCDGIYKKEKEGKYFNLLSFLFNQAIREMSKVINIAGCSQETIHDLAGVGDLHVTSVAGRNRKFGELIGKGIPGEEAFRQMAKDGEYAEGYFALKLVIPWLAQSATKEMIDDFIEKELPLLHTLRSIMIEGAKPDEQLKKMILKLGY
ncbi:MAG TPA: hypothetical protein GXZ93_06745 [Actinobacteria bacterium]|jgi:glycerol-3-phosphate dehydrogenase (NAD(P)+)|nr:hypothetical protein [Actinomycetota bacterium]